MKRQLPSAAQAAHIHQLELAVHEGLEPVARSEILARLGRAARIAPGSVAGQLVISYRGELAPLLRLRIATSIYLVRHYPVPRPKALLGDAHWRALLAQIATVRQLHPQGAFGTFAIGAAGTESAVMQRIRSELALATGLSPSDDEGDLHLRIRPSRSEQGGWEVLTRLAPRPLATRSWRVCNMEGALSGPVAHAMALLTRPTPRDVYLNLGCGSGSLLIERVALGPARRLIGCDISPEARQCAERNIAAAKASDKIELHDWDATALPLPDASVDVIVADLPFGHRVGSHEANVALYPPLLREATRVVQAGGLVVLLSHEVRLMERLISESPRWDALDAIRISLGGLYPRIFVLKRR